MLGQFMGLGYDLLLCPQRPYVACNRKHRLMYAQDTGGKQSIWLSSSEIFANCPAIYASLQVDSIAPKDLTYYSQYERSQPDYAAEAIPLSVRRLAIVP